MNEKTLEQRIGVYKCTECGRMLVYKSDDPGCPREGEQFICLECQRKLREVKNE